MKFINVFTLILLIVGGLNWGLVGLFSFDLVAAIFGAGSGLARIVYILVGLSAAWQIVPLFIRWAPAISLPGRTDRTWEGPLVLLWAAILVTIIVFYPVNAVAALLLAPYLAWVSFAAALYMSIWRRNRSKPMLQGAR